MSEYVTAKSYECFPIIKEFEKNGKMYGIIRCSCPRCSGTGRVNIPVEQGICFKCRGTKFYTEEVRLYTKEERAKLDAQAERRKEQKDAEMRSKAASKLASWKTKSGFSAEDITYVPIGDTYAIKDELKEEGFIYDPVIGWHRAEPTERPHIEVKFDEIFQATAWGDAHYITGAADIIKEKKKVTEPPCESKWVGEEGEKIECEVVLDRISGCETRFGWSNIYYFKQDKNILVWFTKTNINAEVGDMLHLSGTIKKHDTYNDRKQTILTRVKVKEV